MTTLDEPFAALIELLKSNDEPFATVTGPISEDEIAAAERELGVVFPKSYRTFLRHFGAGNMLSYEIYGLPREQLWGDIVMMNQLGRQPRPVSHWYVKFTEDARRVFYLDTSQTNSAGECPVMAIGRDGEEAMVADSFLDFLRQVSNNGC